jgi:hypothetical protein
MRAMLACSPPVLARPVNSSMVFGGCPAASTPEQAMRLQRLAEDER